MRYITRCWSSNHVGVEIHATAIFCIMNQKPNGQQRRKRQLSGIYLSVRIIFQYSNHIMQRSPSQVKGVGFRSLSCRGSWVRIPPSAPISYLFNARYSDLTLFPITSRFRGRLFLSWTTDGVWLFPLANGTLMNRAWILKGN